MTAMITTMESMKEEEGSAELRVGNTIFTCFHSVLLKVKQNLSVKYIIYFQEEDRSHVARRTSEHLGSPRVQDVDGTTSSSTCDLAKRVMTVMRFERLQRLKRVMEDAQKEFEEPEVERMTRLKKQWDDARHRYEEELHNPDEDHEGAVEGAVVKPKPKSNERAAVVKAKPKSKFNSIRCQNQAAFNKMFKSSLPNYLKSRPTKKHKYRLMPLPTMVFKQ